MKNTYKYIIGFMALLALIIACTKGVDVRTEVEFTVSEQHESEGFINAPLTTSITVTPEALKQGHNYAFSYTLDSGQGYFQSEGGLRIVQGEKIPLNPLTATLSFIGTAAGSHTVTITAEDNFGSTEVVTITYAIAPISTKWTATVPNDQIYLGSDETITLTLGTETANTGVTYEKMCSFSEGSGNLYTLPDNSFIVLDEFEAITPGTYEIKYRASELGLTTLNFLLKDSNGQELTATVGFEVVVEDTTAPTITLIGEGTINLTVGDTYTDQGATALDNKDGNITAAITTVNPVDTNVAGTYSVTYNVSDAAGNNAAEVTRTVTVNLAPQPTATFDPTAYVTSSQEKSGTLVIENGPIALKLSGNGGFGLGGSNLVAQSGYLTFTIVGFDTWELYLPAGDAIGSMTTQEIPPGNYNYTISRSGGFISGYGSVSAQN